MIRPRRCFLKCIQAPRAHSLYQPTHGSWQVKALYLVSTLNLCYDTHLPLPVFQVRKAAALVFVDNVDDNIDATKGLYGCLDQLFTVFKMVVVC